MANLTCAEFEVMLDGYRDGVLPAAQAAAAHTHVDGCASCAELLASTNEAVAMLAALPRLEMPAHVTQAIYARTARPRSGFGGGGMLQLWRTLTSPRMAMGLAMAVFAVSLILNAAQINLRNISFQQLSPERVADNVERGVSRSWGHVEAYYQDLRVVYEIQAALHQMRQEPAPAPQQPTGHTLMASPFPFRQRSLA